MNTVQRRKYILDVIERDGKASVNDLVHELGVSSVTVRKDLSFLCEQGIAQRMYGGIMKRNRVLEERNQNQKIHSDIQEKKEIANVAVNEINDGEAVLISGGTTTQELISAILKREWKNLTIITNSLPIALQLEKTPEGISVITLGGMYRPSVQTYVGPLTENSIKNMVVDKCFMSVNNISMDYGVTCADISEGWTLRAVMQASVQHYLLCTSSKFEANAMFRICGIDDFEMIITDSKIKEEHISRYASRKCKLVVAPPLESDFEISEGSKWITLFN